MELKTCLDPVARRKKPMNACERGRKDARFIKKTYLLNELTPCHKMLLEFIKSRKEVLSNRLWEDYLSEARKKEMQPIALRTYLVHINKLRALG